MDVKVECINDENLKVQCIRVGMPLLDDAGHAHLCLAQTPFRDMENIKHSRSCPTTLAMLSALLHPGGLRDWATVPLLICLPEYSLVSRDWNIVDGWIRQYPMPVVLAVGMSWIEGKDLSEWREGNGDTRRMAALGAEIVGSRGRYNWGCIWIHRSKNDTICVAFVKNWLEQIDELNLVTTMGQHIVAVEFDDIILYPAICSDLLGEVPNAPRVRIGRHAAKCRGKPHLVVGLVCQPKNPWTQAWLGSIEQIVGNHPAVLTLINQAFDVHSERIQEDRWRCLSGIYRSTLYGDQAEWRGVKNGTRSIHAIPSSSPSSVMGNVIRRTLPWATLGKVRWPPYGNLQGRFWSEDASFTFVDGRLHTVDSRDVKSAYDYELARFLRTEKGHLNGRIEAGVSKLHDSLSHCDATSDRETSVAEQAIFGIGRSANESFLAEHQDALIDMSKLVGFYLTSLTFKVNAAPGTVGHLSFKFGAARGEPTSASLLIWVNGKRPESTIRKELMVWARDHSGHPPLLVLARAKTPIMSGKLDSRRDSHGEITVVEDPQRRSIVDVPGATVACLPADEWGLNEVMEDATGPYDLGLPDAEEVAAALIGRFERMLE